MRIPAVQKWILSFSLAILFVGSLASIATAGEAGVKAGILKCKDVPGKGINLIITSTTYIRCQFKDVNGGREYYKGETGIGLGVDLNFERDIELIFSVVAAQFKPGTYQLAGKYVGGSASVAAGVGAGVHVLIGGSEKSVSLRPAVETSKGYAVAAGLGYMYLEPDRRAKRK